MDKRPIIVVGAGPVGVTLTKILSDNDIPVILIEKEAQPSEEWRASTFHAGTLELLEETGIVDEMLRRGIEAKTVQYRDREKGKFAEFDFTKLSDETKYPFRLQLPQSTYVEIVYEELKKKKNVNIRFNTELVDFEQKENGVTVTVKTSKGEEQLDTPFLLGADGGRSVVRKRLDVSFDGYTHEERWLLVGTPVSFLNYIPDLAPVNYISDSKQFLFILQVPEAWRFLYPIPPSVSDEEALDDNNIQKTMKEALKTTDNFPLVEGRIYRIHQRVSDTFYKNRVVLVGDAAHLNSPMGGLGLNSGIHDAVDLSKRIIRIYKESANVKAELDKYSEVRRSVALDHVKEISERNTRTVKESDNKVRMNLLEQMKELAEDPVRSKEWMLKSTLIASVREIGIGEKP